MNRESVHSVKEKNMYRNALQLNTDVKERTNEEGLMNHRKGGGGGGGDKEMETSRPACN